MTPPVEPLWRPDPVSDSTRAKWRASAHRVLLVVPHPDDESYGCAGTLARAAQDPDCSIALLILTSGEAATVGKERGIAPAELATIREKRLERVVEWLGLEALFLARLPDSGLAQLPLAPFAASIRSAIDLFEPTVLLGHDPRGVNAHADHIASHWALRTALPGSSVRRFAMLAHGEESVAAVAPRLLFPTRAERIHLHVQLTAEEIALKERCLDEHEAIMTLDADRAAREGLLHRLPIEEWEFFGEPAGLRAADLFADLPADPPRF